MKKRRMGGMRRRSGIAFQVKGQACPRALLCDYLWHTRRTPNGQNSRIRGCAVWGVSVDPGGMGRGKGAGKEGWEGAHRRKTSRRISPKRARHRSEGRTHRVSC